MQFRSRRSSGRRRAGGRSGFLKLRPGSPEAVDVAGAGTRKGSIDLIEIAPDRMPQRCASAAT